MGKRGEGITLTEYYENMFDVPLEGRDDHLVAAQDCIHLAMPCFSPSEESDLVKAENLIIRRGAIRAKDYLISCHYDHRGIAMATLHTTTKFLSKDDMELDSEGYGHVLE
jgi:hypothetical protein